MAKVFEFRHRDGGWIAFRDMKGGDASQPLARADVEALHHEVAGTLLFMDVNRLGIHDVLKSALNAFAEFESKPCAVVLTKCESAFSQAEFLQFVDAPLAARRIGSIDWPPEFIKQVPAEAIFPVTVYGWHNGMPAQDLDEFGRLVPVPDRSDVRAPSVRFRDRAHLERDAMTVHVSLRSVAWFGKVPPSDYGWAVGRSELPGAFAAMCEALPGVSDAVGVYVAIAGEFDGHTWVARAFRGGTDASGRRVTSIEAARSSSIIPRFQWPAVVMEMTQQPTVGPGQVPTTYLPTTAETADVPAVSVDLLIRAALGLPVEADPAEATALLRGQGHRFPVLCFSGKHGASRPLAWPSVLAVNFATEAIAGADRQLLEWAAGLALSRSDLDALLAVPVDAARRVVRWLCDPSSVTASADGDTPDAFLLALARVGRSRRPGPALIRAIQRDFDLATLPLAVIRELLPSLGDAAATVLARREVPGEIPLSACVELARAGLLADEALVPPRAWMRTTIGVPELMCFVQNLLRSRGLDRDQIAWVLDRPSRVPAASETEGLHHALQTSKDLGIPEPRNALRAWLATCATRDDVVHWARVASTGGDWSSALAALVLDGTMPAEGVLSETDVCSALGQRNRHGVASRVLLPLLRQLIDADRRAEATSLVLTCGSRFVAELSAIGQRAFLAAHGRGQAPSVPSAESIRSLVESGLCGPADIVPDSAAALDTLAPLWPATASLQALLQRKPIVTIEHDTRVAGGRCFAE